MLLCLQSLRDSILDCETWFKISKALKMLGPIQDCIHNIEADK